MESITSSLELLAQRLTVMSSTDPVIREHMRRVAQWILAVTPEPQLTQKTTDGANHVTTPVAAEVSTLTSPPVGEEARFFVDARVHLNVAVPAQQTSSITALPPPVPPSAWSEPSTSLEINDADLPLIEARCRLKAEGARWAARRQRMLQEHVDFHSQIAPLDRDIIERARALPDCYLWMCSPNAPTPADLSQWDQIASCFETFESALVLTRGLAINPGSDRDAFEQALHLLAEASSALRVAIDRIDGGSDRDQLRVHNWLRQTSAREQVFIARYMKINDPADPDAIADLDQRIEQLDATLAAVRDEDKKRRSLFKRIHYHMRNRTNPEGITPYDWQRIIETVDELINNGERPSSRELRDVLAPVIDDLPDVGNELPANFHLVLRELDRYLESRPPATVQEQGPAYSEDVHQVARMLHGKAIVLIGGLRRRYAEEALKTAFGLRDLYWLDVPDHESITSFEPYIARSEVAVVIVAIRWSSHSYSGVSQYCTDYEKCMVRLRAGYNPNQVAKQILEQCGQRLGQKG